jgi:trimeric autotransporter adhesin
MTEPAATVPVPSAASAAATEAAASPVQGGFSPDAAWWWDGTQWVPTVTPDGRWRWDGRGWQMHRHLDLANPEAAQADLLATADDLFAQAGALASQRRMEWAVPPDLFPVLDALDAATVTMNARRGRDKEQARAQVHAIAADLGRRITGGAPPEVGALLDLARRHNGIANSLAAAQSDLAAAQADHDAAVSAAAATLEAAERARSEAIAAVQAEVGEAERARSVALAGQRSKVKLLRAPGAGAELGRYAGLALFERVIDTPEGRALVAGSKASVQTVEELFAGRRELVARLQALGGYGGQLLSEADWTWPGHHFLVIESGSFASVVPVSVEEVGAAHAFAANVNAASSAASAATLASAADLAQAEAELAEASAEGQALSTARARLRKVEADPKLTGAVEAARSAAARASANTARIEAAREKLAAAGRAALETPAPLAGSSAP